MSSISNVIKEDLCVGCGGCKVATRGIVEVGVTRIGTYKANLESADAATVAAASAVCPFSDESRNEDQIADDLYKNIPAIKYDKKIGYYHGLYGGRRTDAESVHQTSSGGLTSWIAEKLLGTGAIDGLIHVGPGAAQSDRLFSYCISHSIDEVRAQRKSQYYSVNFAEMLLTLRGNGKRYMFIGVPCFVKAARLLAEQDEVLRHQLKYFTALVCGHMKSSAFAELLAWQVGVPPKQLAKVDFRIKVESEPTPAYQFGAWKKGERSVNKETTRELVGGNWGHAAFQLKACDFCDDIWGETADVALGDAWLPEYVNDWRGTNVLAVRHPDIHAILKSAMEAGEISLDALEASALVKSQDGNYRHRWDGLSVRLADAKKAGHWIPRKRIAPGSRPVDFLRRQIVRIRQDMGEQSHSLFLKAKDNDSLEVYLKGMRLLTKRMNLVYRLINRPSPKEIFSKIARRIRARLPV